MISPVNKTSLGKRASIVLAALIALTGCSGMLQSDQPAERVYWMTPYLATQPVQATSLPSLTLVVDAAPGLDTDRLLLLEDDARLNQYAGARWPDHAPELLSSMLQRTLESTGRFERVYSRSGARNTDWTLELELRRFYVTTSPTSTANIALAGHLDCGGSKRISLTAGAAVAEDRLSLIVAAFQQALNDLSSDLVSQLETQPCSLY